MMDGIASGLLANLLTNISSKTIRDLAKSREWKNSFVNAGQFFSYFEKDNNQIFEDLAKALSKENMEELANDIEKESGIDLKNKLQNYISTLLGKYEIPKDVIVGYSCLISELLINEIQKIDPIKYAEYYLDDWKKEYRLLLDSQKNKLDTIILLLESVNGAKNDVVSANDLDIKLKRKTENPSIGIDFFEIDDDEFKVNFKNQINNKKICVRGNYVEETLYCVLNELWKLKENRPIFVVKNLEGWEKLEESNKTNNIYIPLFSAEEITPIERNTNIFIYTNEIPVFSNEVIDLRARTLKTIEECLIKSGASLERAIELIQETNGLYVLMRKILSNGQLPTIPKWKTNLDLKIQNTCLLLGKWTESDGDKKIIEQISGYKYNDFVDKLDPYTKGEDPLVRVINRNNKKLFYLTSVEITWSYLDVKMTDEIWNKFVNSFYIVFADRDKLSFCSQNELMEAQLRGETTYYSTNIRKGMLNTLIIKSGYKDRKENQKCLDSIVENVLSNINDYNSWKYISEYFKEFIEISPKIIINRLNREIDKNTGLIDLFENQDSDVFLGKNHYINILFGVEQLLVQKEYAYDAYEWLLKIDNKKISYRSNSPGSIIKELLCPWLNISVFKTVTDKKMLAQKSFDIDDNAWYLIYDSLPENQSTIVGCLCKPKYRDTEEIVPNVKLSDLNSVIDCYIELLVDKASLDPNKWVKILDYSENLKDDLRNMILDKLSNLLEKFDDDNLLLINNELIHIIYEHRYHRDASWSLQENELVKYENVLKLMNFKNKAYEWEYLFHQKYQTSFLNPIPYDEDIKKEGNKNLIRNLQIEAFNQIKAGKYKLEDLATLCLKINNTTLGEALGLYWNPGKFDFKIFNILLYVQRTAEMAMEYYKEFKNQTFELFDDVLNCLFNHEINDESLSKFYRIEAFYSKNSPKIYNARNSIKKEYWKSGFLSNDRCYKKDIEECQQYGTINSYIELLYLINDEGLISKNELFDCLLKVDKLSFESNGPHLNYYLKEILNTLKDTCFGDYEKCEKLANIEIMFFGLLDWEDMNYFKSVVCQDPTIYAELIKIIYKKEHQKEIEKTDVEDKKISYLYGLYYKAKFCPAEINNNVEYEALEEWITKFKKLLEENDQAHLFDYTLGRLLPYSPIDTDEHMPCTAVRLAIEKYFSDDLSESYRTTVYNERGVFSPTAGKKELEIAGEFKKNSDYLYQNNYIRTASIYKRLADTYMYESSKEREVAENGRI